MGTDNLLTCTFCPLRGIGEICAVCKSEAEADEKKSTPLRPSHYTRWKMQPLDFIAVNNIDFLRGNIIKYILRHDAGNGLEDLEKARVYLEKLITKVKKEDANA